MSSLDFFDQTQIKTECSPKVSLSRKIIKIIFFEIRPQITCITFFSSFLSFYELTFFIFYILFFCHTHVLKIIHTYDDVYYIHHLYFTHFIIIKLFLHIKIHFFLLILKNFLLLFSLIKKKN